MDKRELTGKWYLKPAIWGNFAVMVEVEVTEWDDPTYGNGGGSFDPPYKTYEKAKGTDLMELGINIVTDD